MKLAIVQDGLMCRAGGEQVALSFHKAFSESPIFTLAFDPKNTFEDFQTANIVTSWMQYISKKDSIVKRFFFPIGLLAAKSLDLREYDVVLMSTTHCAKYVKTSSKSIVICYSHNPFRLVWFPEEYNQVKKFGNVKKFLFNAIIKYLRRIDKKSIEKVNYLLTNSNNVLSRLVSVYDNYTGEPIEVIHPPVNINKFYISPVRKEYFLVVSRLEYYKRVDLVIETFNQLSLPLIIVGKGELEIELKLKAKNNITFLKDLDSVQLSRIYSEARAFIFPQLEDFGITALEANASGLPIIAFGEGGILETQIEYNETNSNNATAVFFTKQTSESLFLAVQKFIKIEYVFNSLFIREHSIKFSEETFINRIRDYVNEKIHSR